MINFTHRRAQSKNKIIGTISTWRFETGYTNYPLDVRQNKRLHVGIVPVIFLLSYPHFDLRKTCEKNIIERWKIGYCSVV